MKFIKENEGEVRRAIFEKQIDLDLDELFALDKEKIELSKTLEQFRSEKNSLSKNYKDVNSSQTFEQGKSLKNIICKLKLDFESVQKKVDDLMVMVPNILAPDTPKGKSDQDNVEIFRSGGITNFSFLPKTHMELGRLLNILDLERGSKVAGYRGYYVMNEGVSLILGFMMYAMNKMIVKGFSPMLVPTMVNEFALFGSGYFKGREYNDRVDEIYRVTTINKEDGNNKNNNNKNKFLVGTAEPSLLSYYSGEVLEETKLPIKICGFSQCYRNEIGAYGQDNKGVYRVHEFMKVEQVIILKADIEESNYLQDEMVKISMEMHEELGIPYRQLRICSGDMGLGKYRAFDLEAWMPGLNRWGETGSASNFLDWQSRRLNIRYKTLAGDKKYVFMLNNTALPSPRIFIAILENYQQSDGSIVVPEIIKKFMPVSCDLIRNR